MNSRKNRRRRYPSLCVLVCATAFASAWAPSRLALAQPDEDTPTAKGHTYSADTLEFWSNTLYIEGYTEFPVPGRMKVSENNSPVPRDRVHYTFNHFHNAVNSSVTDQFGTTTNRSAGVEKYTAGFEKTYADGRMSVDVRLPVWQFPSSVFTAGFATNGGTDVGNLSIMNKAMIYESDVTAFTIGCGLTVPTGPDASFTVDTDVFTFRNQAVHASPFVALVMAPPGRRLFFQAFVQADIPLNGNTLEFGSNTPGVNGGTLGILYPQNVLCSDLSLGYWLYRRGDSRGLTGLAWITEMHHLTALEDANPVSGTTLAGATDFRFGNLRNRYDIVLTTFGLHAEFNDNSNLWLGAVLPLTDEDDRFFDSELQIQFNRRF